MGKVIETRVNRFDGGMVNDARSKAEGVCQLTKHFDALTDKHRLIPYRSSETGNDTASRVITDFCYAAGKLWGLGVDDGNDPTIYYKDTFTDGTWSATANNTADTTDNRVTGALVHYKGFLYGYAGTTDVFKYDITGSAAWAHPVAFTHAGLGVQGVVHSKDDMLYMAGTNTIHRNNAGSWTSPVLTLPSNLVITSLCEYGNYLAIACKPAASLGDVSRVFLWDRDSSVTTLAESIDWGLGDIQIIEELEGQLIGISSKTDSSLLFGSTHSFKYYAGAAGAVEFAKFTGFGFSFLTALSRTKQKVNNRIYFLASYGPENGDAARAGVWSVGRSSPTSPFAVNIEYLANNDSPPTSLDGFFLIGSYMFIAYSVSGSLDGNMSKTSDTSTAFTASSTYESVIFNADDSSVTKQLIGVTVTTAPLPTAGQIVLKYRKNEETSWTTIFTNTTDSSVSYDAVNIESTGATFPEYKEIQFQILSTGGAIPTGFKFKEEIIDKQKY